MKIIADRFARGGPGAGEGAALYALISHPVPEPTTAALRLAGLGDLGDLGVVARRRRGR